MPHRLFFFNKMAEGMSPDLAEQFLRHEDLPMGRSLASFTAYSLTRLEGTIEDQVPLPCDFIDVADVTDVDEYVAEIESMANDSRWLEFVKEFDRHFPQTNAIYGVQIK